MRMDFEVYWIPRPLPDGNIYGLPRLIAMADEAEIDLSVLMPLPDFRPRNRQMAEAVADFDQRERFILCCQVNPHFGLEAVDELEYCVSELGMRGLKLMPTYHGYAVHSPLVDPVMEKARQLGIVVNIHSGSANALPLQIAALASRYPEVPIVMDHMGYRYYLRDAILAAQACPNIYLGTTLVSPAEPVVIWNAVREVGPERIVFGSNGPGTHPDMAVEGILRLHLGNEAEALILGENLARLHGVD
ncbi:MAG TPA: amidohydrolase [Anaerolineae bacterium]|nr:amidohydrolase [Anaerolineae bacterium]